MSDKKIALIDGYGFVFRAYHAMPPLTSPDGTPVGAVYGFTSMLIKLLASMEATHMAVVFDSGSKSFRNDIYPEYKANRPPCPEDLLPQFPLVREAAQALNLDILEKEGYEADDIIATVAKNAKSQGYKVIVVSSDKDLMQLIDGDVEMLDAMRNREIGSDQVVEKFGVTPNKLLDVLSLMGDSSDNVPGVPSIGPKTAAELINQYDTLENLLENAQEIKQNKRRQALLDHKDQALLSKELIELAYDVKLPITVDSLNLKEIDPAKLIGFLKNQGFRSLVSRIEKEFDVSQADFANDDSDAKAHVAHHSSNKTNKNPSNPKPQNIEHIIVEEVSQISRIADLACESGVLAVDFNANISSSKGEKSDIADNETIIQHIILAPNPCQTFLIPVSYSNSENDADARNDAGGHASQEIAAVDLFGNPVDNKNSSNSDDGKNGDDKNGDDGGNGSDNLLATLPLDEALPLLNEIFIDKSILKVGYDVKKSMRMLRNYGYDLDAFDDIMVMSYVLGAGLGNHGLRSLIDINLDEDIESGNMGEIFKAQSDGKDLLQYCESSEEINSFLHFKVEAILKLYHVLKERIVFEKLNFIYERFERALIPVLADMEIAGIKIDIAAFKDLNSDFNKRILDLEAEIHKLANKSFNIGSPKQLSEVLFDNLSLPAGKKSKSGIYSTKSDILENLEMQGHVIAGKILNWRHLSKLKNTYVDVLPKLIDHKTGRVHTTFSNTNTSTGRLSSNNPNLQNIPIRSEDGMKIRKGFIAQKGCKLISADYSQIELRVLSHVAGIDALCKAFKDDKDIHATTAAQVFSIDEDKVDSNMRRKAKAINFGIIYGISAFGLAKQLNIPRGEASEYIKAYFETYPGIQEYMEKYQTFAKSHGFVETIMGRKCYVKGINDKNPVTKGLAERLAINAPIQGSAADIIKKAMIDLDEELKAKYPNSKLLLQIHDELIIESPQKDAPDVAKLLQKIMEKAVAIDVPLKVDVSIGDSWAQIH